MKLEFKKREPNLLSRLEIPHICQLRKCFEISPRMSASEFFRRVNQLLSPEDKLSPEQCAKCFAEMDVYGRGEIDVLEFLDYILSEYRQKRFAINDAIGYIPPRVGRFYPTKNIHLNTIDIQIAASKLTGMDTIRKIYHLNTSSPTSYLTKHNFGIYVTPIGKSSIGFWRSDLSMIKDELLYSSKEIPELTSAGVRKRNVGLKNTLKQVKDNYEKQGPEFDLVIMEDLQLIACFKIFHRSLLFYDLKYLELKYSISELPLEISCADYVPNQGGVSRLFLGGATGGFLIIELLTSSNVLTALILGSVKHYKYREILSRQVRAHKVACHEKGYLTKVHYYSLMLKNFIITSSLFDETSPKGCNTLSVTEFTVASTTPMFIEVILATISFQATDSINTFATEKAGALFSGGWDKLIRLWHVADVMEESQRCHFVFFGHRTPIIGIYYHSRYFQIISMSVDAVINVWCSRQKTLIQSYSFAHLMPRLYPLFNSYRPKLPKILPAFYFCERTESILLGAESLIAIPFGEVIKEEKLV
ncbi:hypothetical protein M8J76_009557 [Diaphorina citri]|nr:hypothetical protein M8J75_003895 [Diaphorina citri]KAI5723680.1 hypothetical protein M8J76_009557 [Diaphorina citri]KAI5727961.1 hypothetical protein M8J77_009278 [Diaphorina citri]